MWPSWRFASGVDCRDSPWSIIKDLFVIICNNILEKPVISLPWKKTCYYGYAIFLILLTKNQYQKPKWSVYSFFLSLSSGNTLWIGMGCSQVLILEYFVHRLHFTAPLIAWRSRFGFIFLWHINRTKLWKPVCDLAVSDDIILVMNPTNFLKCFCNIFVIPNLPQNYMSNIYFQFFYFRNMRS